MQIVLYFSLFIIVILTFTDSILDVTYWLDFSRSITNIYNSGYGSENIKIDETNSSMLTRFTIWFASIRMFFDNFVFGVGFGQWNFLKTDYSIPFNVLLDPHNDYIFYFVSYGFISGFLFVHMTYLRAIIYVIRTRRCIQAINPYYYALFGLSISSLTNANTSKHQVAVIVSSLIMMASFYSKENNMEMK
ncbi:O-antigen ligase family protein [Vibrio fortis]|uniref:O-antigen ligase family protein n=1 Tax=Vibrio fortis TaxID=212667 RepID=A0A5N3S7A2_9VIBR|nr:O-antigen ligase family protein [Vibrio fortis]